MAAPRHVLLELDEQGDLHSVGEESDAEEPRGDARRETPDGPEAPDRSDDGARTIASRFWGVSWDNQRRKWRARYTDANGKERTIKFYSYFTTDPMLVSHAAGLSLGL